MLGAHLRADGDRRDVFATNLGVLRVSALAFSSSSPKLRTENCQLVGDSDFLAQIYYNVLNVGVVGAIQTTFPSSS
jgi:hypothetical protein